MKLHNHTIDVDRVQALFNIVQLVANVAPGYTNISSAAMEELREVNNACKTIAAQMTSPHPQEPSEPPKLTADQSDAQREPGVEFEDVDDRHLGDPDQGTLLEPAPVTQVERRV